MIAENPLQLAGMKDFVEKDVSNRRKKGYHWQYRLKN